MSAASGQSVPGHERAETYLRLQVEAELRTALGFPRYRPPMQHPVLIGIFNARRGFRRRRAVTRTVLRAQSRPTQCRSLLQRSVSRIWQPLAPAWHRTMFGFWHFRAPVRARLRRARREQAPPPAEACLDRVTGLATAFVSAWAVDEQTAESVIEDLRRALAARCLTDQSEMFTVLRRARSSPAAPDAVLRRAVPVGAIAHFEAMGRSGLAYLGTMLLDADWVNLTVSARFAPAATPDAMPVDPTPWNDPRMAVFAGCWAADDRGGSYHGSFTGGGDDEDWDGTLHFHPPPPATARWLDVTVPGATPVRVDLTVAPVSHAVTSTPLAGGLAECYVDRVCVELLQSGDLDGLADGKAPSQAAAVAGLLISGVLTERSPALRRFVTVARRLRFGLPAALASIRPQELPAEWLAMQDRWDCDDGPTGVIALAAMLPVLDGAQCVVTGLRSEPHGATLRVHGRGWPQPRVRTLPHEPFIWTARDDVGGWYVSGSGGSSYSGGGWADMDLRLYPAISPAARSLEIIVTGKTGQVSVTVPLDWQEDL